MPSKIPYQPRLAVYLVLVVDGKVLLSLRQNSGWRDGEYTLVSGHLLEHETPREAMCREALEEIGIVIEPHDLELVHNMYHVDNMPYTLCFFRPKAWKGEPSNCEPFSCAELRWVAPHDLPENTVPNVVQALELWEKGSSYSELQSQPQLV